jgi:hypothetical protein
MRRVVIRGLAQTLHQPMASSPPDQSLSVVPAGDYLPRPVWAADITYHLVKRGFV